MISEFGVMNDLGVMNLLGAFVSFLVLFSRRLACGDVFIRLPRRNCWARF